MYYRDLDPWWHVIPFSCWTSKPRQAQDTARTTSSRPCCSYRLERTRSANLNNLLYPAPWVCLLSLSLLFGIISVLTFTFTFAWYHQYVNFHFHYRLAPSVRYVDFIFHFCWLRILWAAILTSVKQIGQNRRKIPCHCATSYSEVL